MASHTFFSKAAFNFDKEKTALSGSKVILLISVGQKYHEGDKLAATIDLINKSGFSSCTIAVADTLQRHNYLGMSYEAAYRFTYELGTSWIARNSEVLAALSIPNNILRWDEALNDISYLAFREDIEGLYVNDPAYKEAINETIGIFIDRMVKRDPSIDTVQAFIRCLNYLMEECPIIMPIWAAKGYDFVIYPQPMTAAMDATRERFVVEKYPGKERWLSLRFKKRSIPNFLNNVFLQEDAIHYMVE
ncbi:hypothetical protein [Photorhabdus hindustanensis]|uniref:tRNA-dependent cyclodipeptide synthase n=1 Tax=Photorhabdus hindustanensis TaxID=2918802 RepID=A0A2S8PWH2_9GAMM|nr:hypothetical protein [Photorhabdus hindustanensis]PQQ23292.1 tRNA-dependent cyclodipeptide synthase [Photorhabdus hindustanensis]